MITTRYDLRYSTIPQIYVTDAPAALHLTVCDDQQVSRVRLLIARTQFDEEDLSLVPVRNLTKYGNLTFINYEIFNASALYDKGLLLEGDLDCALSTPNAIRSAHNSNTSITSSVFMHGSLARGATSLFDLHGFAIKPLGLMYEGTSIYINAWEIHEGRASYAWQFFDWWGGFDGNQSIPIQILDFGRFGDWGRNVNLVEITAQAADGTAVGFCLDDIVVSMHEV